MEDGGGEAGGEVYGVHGVLFCVLCFAFFVELFGEVAEFCDVVVGDGVAVSGAGCGGGGGDGVEVAALGVAGEGGGGACDDFGGLSGGAVAGWACGGCVVPGGGEVENGGFWPVVLAFAGDGGGVDVVALEEVWGVVCGGAEYFGGGAGGDEVVNVGCWRLNV